jgi:hypothetical protein
LPLKGASTSVCVQRLVSNIDETSFILKVSKQVNAEQFEITQYEV